MDNEIIELHPPLVTFASIDYDENPNPDPRDQNQSRQNPPPPAPYDHKSAGPMANPNLVVVNRNDLESILVSKQERGTAAQIAQQQQQAMAAAQAAHLSAQNYHKQPNSAHIQPRHGQHHRVSKTIRPLWNDLHIRYLCIIEIFS